MYIHDTNTISDTERGKGVTPGYRQLSRQREREKEREREGGEREGGERGSGTVYHSFKTFYCLTCRANLQIAASGPWVSTSGCRAHEGVPA